MKELLHIKNVVVLFYFIDNEKFLYKLILKYFEKRGKKMALNRKEIYILEEISRGNFPIKYFAEKYSVSERNIRYSVDNINFYLRREKLKEIEIKKANLELYLEKEKLENFIENLDMTTYIFSQKERENYILVKYLFEEKTTIKEIEDFLKVSRTTIKKDMKNLEEYIKKFELYFTRTDNKIEISGNEKKLRHLKLLKLLEYIEIKGKDIIFYKKKYLNEKLENAIIKKYVEKYYKKEISETVLEIEKKFNTVYPEQFKNIITLYLISTVERIENGHIILRKNNSEFLKSIDEYNSVKEILGKIIDKNYEFEHLHLLEYFLSGEYVDCFYENLSIAEKFLKNTLKTLDKSLGYKFSENKKFFEKLLKYLIPAIYRIKNNFKLYKELDTEKVSFEVLEKVKEGVLENNKYLSEPLRDEEILYMAENVEEFIKYENIKKISLKKLLSIVEENSEKADLKVISEKIKEEFGQLINDDTP